MRLAQNSVTYAMERYGVISFFKNAFSMAISDAAVVSFQKSGRTWLRLMYAKMLSEGHKLGKIRLDTEYMTLGKKLPNVLFSHGGCTINNNKLNFRRMFRRKKLVLLVRDPRATMVSLFHDHTKRNFWYKGGSNSEFIRDKEWGLSKVITFLNDWAEEVKKRKGKDVLVIKYEDLYLDTPGELKKFLDFLGVSYTEEAIADAVHYGLAGNMRKMELANTLKDYRMRPGSADDKQSYRTRKCKLGSFREELKEDDLDYIDRALAEELDPMFGYNYQWREFNYGKTAIC